MKAVRYKPHLHFKSICEWAEARGMNPVQEALMPEIGRIVEGHAAIFLFRTDSGLCYVENLITNPDVTIDVALKAMDLCMDAIMEDAKDEGFKAIRFSTFIPGVLEHGKKRGFQIHPRAHKIMTKGI